MEMTNTGAAMLAGYFSILVAPFILIAVALIISGIVDLFIVFGKWALRKR